MSGPTKITADDASLSNTVSGDKVIRSMFPPESATFAPAGTEILRLTFVDGMYYKGEFIADAGEARKAFLAAMAALQSSAR